MDGGFSNLWTWKVVGWHWGWCLVFDYSYFFFFAFWGFYRRYFCLFVHIRLTNFLKNDTWLLLQNFIVLIISVVFMNIAFVGNLCALERGVTLKLAHLIPKSIWKINFTAIELVCTNSSSISAQPLPQPRNVPSPWDSEIAKIGNNDSQVLGIFLPCQPKIHPFVSLLHIKGHFLVVVQIRVLFKNSCWEHCQPDWELFWVLGVASKVFARSGCLNLFGSKVGWGRFYTFWLLRPRKSVGHSNFALLRNEDVLWTNISDFCTISSNACILLLGDTYSIE